MDSAAPVPRGGPTAIGWTSICLGNRYYDPSTAWGSISSDPWAEVCLRGPVGFDRPTGQFLTRDPLEAMTRSPYGYANNNPINLVDPTGLAPWDGIGEALGDAAGAFGRLITKNAGTISTIASGLSTIAYAGCALSAGTGCGLGLVLSGVSTGLAGVQTYESCARGRGSCVGAVASLGLSATSTAIGGVARQRLASAIAGMPNPYSQAIYLSRQEGVVGAISNGLATLGSLGISGVTC